MSARGYRPRREGSGDPLQNRIAEAMIAVAGTHGYDATTVEAVCARAEVPQADFEPCFADKEECFLYAYDRVAATFGEEVLGAYGSQIAWHDRVWAAAWAALGFMQEDRRRARFFTVEVNKAGERAHERRDRVMQIFADLIDAGRAELDDPDSLTRATAELVSGAIYFTIQSKILEGSLDRGEDFLVDLVYMAVLPYLGANAAQQELRVHSLRGVR